LSTRWYYEIAKTRRGHNECHSAETAVYALVWAGLV